MRCNLRCNFWELAEATDTLIWAVDMLPVCRYQKPTAIQAQALPAALSGRDILVRPGYVLQCWHCPLHNVQHKVQCIGSSNSLLM